MSRTHSSAAAAFLLIVLTAPLPAAGPLTYPEALKRAAEVDERLRINGAERASIEASRLENTARTRPALRLSTNVVTNNSAVEVRFGGAPGGPGGGGGGATRTIQDTLQGDARLEARWDFWQPAHGREQSAFGAEIEASRADLGTVEATVRYEAAGFYLDALEAAARLKVAEADLDRARTEARLGRERLEAGEGSTLGSRQLDLAVQALASAREEAAASVDLARERLRHLLDLDAAPELPDSGAADLPGRPGSLDTAALVETARGSRTEILASRSRVQAARERVVAAAASRRPDAGFAGSVDASTVEGFDGKKVDTRLEVGLRWTFFDSGARTAITDREAERQRQAELELQALTRRVESEVRQSVTGFRIALLAEERTASQRDQAAVALEQTEALYASGSATEMDLSGRRADLAAASARLEEAKLERVRAFVNLRFAVGASIAGGI